MRELTEEERAWNAIATRQVLEGNGLNKELALLIAKEVTDCVRVVPVSSEPECGKPDGHGTPEHLARTGGQPCVREPGHAPPCQGHSRFVAYPDERVSARPVVEASDERIACPKCGANTGHYDLRGELEAALAHAASSQVGASGERKAMEAAWARFLEDNDPEPTMAWVHLAFQTAWNARGVAASTRVPDEAATINPDEGWAHFGCPDCGNITHQPFEGRELAPLCIHSDGRVKWGGPPRSGWTRMDPIVAVVKGAASRVPSAPDDESWPELDPDAIGGTEYTPYSFREAFQRIMNLGKRKATAPSSSAPEQVERLEAYLNERYDESMPGTQGARDAALELLAVLDAVSGPSEADVLWSILSEIDVRGEQEPRGALTYIANVAENALGLPLRAPSGPPESDDLFGVNVETSLAGALRAAIKAFDHEDWCRVLRRGVECDCGLQDARASIDGLIGRLPAGPPTKEER